LRKTASKKKEVCYPSLGHSDPSIHVSVWSGPSLPYDTSRTLKNSAADVTRGSCHVVQSALASVTHNLTFSVFSPKPATLIHGVQKFWEFTLMNKGMDDLRLSNP